MAQRRNFMDKIRNKKWSEPLGDAMSVSASIAGGLSTAGVPFAGLIQAALKYGSSALNPAPSLKDLKEMQQQVEEQMRQSTGHVKELLERELETIKQNIQRPQPELQQDLAEIRQTLQNSASEMVTEMKSIEQGLQMSKKIVHYTYNLVVDIRYKDGIEKIDNAHKVFIKGARNLDATFNEMQSYIFEMQTAAEQCFSPQNIRGYLQSIKVTNDLDVCQNVAQCIVIAQSKYLQMMTAYSVYHKDFDRATQHFQAFNDQYKMICRDFKEEFKSDFKPHLLPSNETLQRILGARPKASIQNYSNLRVPVQSKSKSKLI